jgi:hypothetical protein
MLRTKLFRAEVFNPRPASGFCTAGLYLYAMLCRSDIRKYLLIPSVLCGNYRHEKLFSFIRNVKWKIKARLDTRGDAWEIKPGVYRNISQAECVSNISLITDFVEEGYWVVCEPACVSALVEFLIN